MYIHVICQFFTKILCSFLKSLTWVNEVYDIIPPYCPAQQLLSREEGE